MRAATLAAAPAVSLALALALGAILGFAPPALGQDLLVRIGGAEPRSVTLEIDLHDRAVTKVLSSLQEGLPVEVSYEVEVWQERSRWFDRLVVSEPIAYLIRVDPWSDEFRVDAEGFPSRTFPTEADLEAWLRGQGPFEIAADPPLGTGRSYYLAVRAAVVPLTEEQVGAVERWLGGGSGDRKGLTGVFFDVVLKLSGLGGLEVSGRSERFTPAGGGG
jgi:hypothetical protein